MRATDWWDERIVSGLASYWLYQHLGNLSPDDLDDDPVWAKVRDAGDATRILREFAYRADREIEGTRWSYTRDFGRTRLVVMDSRCGRVLDGERREMVDDDEWAWIEEQAGGDFDHLLLATSLPFALAPADPRPGGLERGRDRRGLGPRWRPGSGSGSARASTWSTGPPSTTPSTGWGRSSRRSRPAGGGGAPGSVVVLSGDVHHTYLAELSFPGAAGGHSPAWQAVCSPLRNPLPPTSGRPTGGPSGARPRP